MQIDFSESYGIWHRFRNTLPDIFQQFDMFFFYFIELTDANNFPIYTNECEYKYFNDDDEC